MVPLSHYLQELIQYLLVVEEQHKLQEQHRLLVQELHHQLLLWVAAVVVLQNLLHLEMVDLVEVLVVLLVRVLLDLLELNQHNQILLQYCNMEILEEIKLALVVLVLLAAEAVQVLLDRQDQRPVQDQEVLEVMVDSIHNLLDL
jgi:hypothetical protein